ncbi:ABC transporter ATP-binding protein [Aeromicrobium sp. Leaf350]|uniref:ABC transporter ATP-binding protein n=1 Tax=Aeromicrobium sp. Leaf350 TaxID=2876565 RepID=UPI001E45C036|nr:ABC transporter ATP-binding protein [Aeromicrobium sp. Leaf350]
MTQHEVVVAGLEHEFRSRGGAVRALDRIDLTIAPGELVTLAGPSGCGKSTLLRILAGLTQPTTGTVHVGADPVTAPGADRGVVFQRPTLYPWLDVRANVEIGLKLRGVPKDERRAIAERQLEVVGLADAADRRPYELSGGMQQRAQIARVLANDPDIILMDEPFGALDALTREKLQAELLDLWRRTGKTILFITHSVDEAVYLGSRVLVMSPRPGRIVFDEPARFVRGGELVPTDEVRTLAEFTDLTTRVREAINH